MLVLPLKLEKIRSNSEALFLTFWTHFWTHLDRDYGHWQYSTLGVDLAKAEAVALEDWLTAGHGNNRSCHVTALIGCQQDVGRRQFGWLSRAPKGRLLAEIFGLSPR